MMNTIVVDGVERSGRQGVHAQTVARCAYDEGPEPKIQKGLQVVGNLARYQRSECKMQMPAGSSNSGAHQFARRMVRQLASLGRVGIIPQEIGESVAYLMGAGMRCHPPPLGATKLCYWHARTLANLWNACHCPSRRRVSKASGLGPWDVIADTAAGSTAVEPDFGPWSSRNSHVQPSALAAAPPSNSSFGPWGGIASAGSSSSSLGLWGSIVAVPDTPTFGPWGYCLVRNF